MRQRQRCPGQQLRETITTTTRTDNDVLCNAALRHRCRRRRSEEVFSLGKRQIYGAAHIRNACTHAQLFDLRRRCRCRPRASSDVKLNFQTALLGGRRMQTDSRRQAQTNASINGISGVSQIYISMYDMI